MDASTDRVWGWSGGEMDTGTVGVLWSGQGGKMDIGIAGLFPLTIRM